MGQVVQMRRNLTSPSHPAFVAYRPMGALGLAPTGGAIASKTGSVAAGAGASAVATGAGYGAVAGPIGIVVGAIVGLALSALLTKNYLNVAQANAGEDQAVQAFNQYRSIAGTVPGRQLGVQAMTAILDGAVYSGLFPLNNQVKTFHEGPLKYPGNPDWVWGIMNDGANNPYTFAWALQQLKAYRSQTNTFTMTPAVVGPPGTMATPMMAAQMRTPGAAAVSLAGLGLTMNPALIGSPGNVLVSSGYASTSQVSAAPAAVPEAVTLVDQFFIPSNQHDSPAWAVPQSSLAHQILYDAADAYLAANAGFLTTPFVASTWNANQIAYSAGGTSAVPATSSTNPPSQVPTSASTSGTVAFPPVAVSVPQPVISNVLNPNATPQLAPSGMASAGGTVTSTTAATSANLDAAMAAQGYTRVGTTSAGFPLYSQAGQVYAYQNGQLYPFGSVAQLAATGNAGSGISVPATGLDPNTLAAIQAAIQQGMSPLQAAQGAAVNLQSQGIPITPDTAGQIADAANAMSAAPAPLLGSSGGTLLLVGGAVLLFILLRKKA